jgi:hypothetical protein
MTLLLVLQLALATLPNPRTTPGATNPAIDWKVAYKTICAPSGWSTKVIRPPASYTNAIKRKQMLALGYTVANPLPTVRTQAGGRRPDISYCVPRSANPACYEEDHLVPLSAGGSPRSERNLWPQPIAEALVKDRLEQTIARGICDGRIDMVDAQRAIANNWVQAYHAYVEGR